jgi:rubrerythrin
METTTHTCRECGEEADEQYTVRLDVIGEEPYYYCEVCGPIAKEIEAMVNETVCPNE